MEKSLSRSLKAMQLESMRLNMTTSESSELKATDFKPKIQTGLQSLDHECAYGGHLIVIFGPTRAGKTAILNSFRLEAMRNDQKYKNYKTTIGILPSGPIGKPSPSDLISGPNFIPNFIEVFECHGHKNTGNWMRELRKSLVDHNQWAVVTIPSIRSSITDLSTDMAICLNTALSHVADYVFSLKRCTDSSGSLVKNIKNSYRCEENRETECFRIGFRPSGFYESVAVEI